MQGAGITNITVVMYRATLITWSPKVWSFLLVNARRMICNSSLKTIKIVNKNKTHQHTFCFDRWETHCRFLLVEMAEDSMQCWQHCMFFYIVQYRWILTLIALPNYKFTNFESWTFWQVQHTYPPAFYCCHSTRIIQMHFEQKAQYNSLLLEFKQ